VIERELSTCVAIAVGYRSDDDDVVGGLRFRVASAGVPIRRADDTIGGRGSNGTADRVSIAKNVNAAPITLSAYDGVNPDGR
jgi:hypothetical protein